jgi:hypothetical protein
LRRQLLLGDIPEQEARRMTLRFWRENNKDQMAGFHRPIRYRDLRY